MRPMRGSVIGLACVALLATGCVYPANERLAIGVSPTVSFGGPGGPGMRASDPTPHTGWATRIEVIPIDGVVHGTTLRTPERIGRRSDGVTVGAYPEVGGGSDPTGLGWWRAARSLGRACGEIVLMPWRSAWTVLGGSASWSPRGIWKRAPGFAVREGTIGPAATRPGHEGADDAER